MGGKVPDRGNFKVEWLKTESGRVEMTIEPFLFGSEGSSLCEKR